MIPSGSRLSFFFRIRSLSHGFLHALLVSYASSPISIRPAVLNSIFGVKLNRKEKVDVESKNQIYLFSQSDEIMEKS